jgi:hypothetical protein
MGQDLVAFEHIVAIAGSAGGVRPQPVVGSPVSALTPGLDTRRYFDGKEPALYTEFDRCFEYHKPGH